jgi:hypothetical protein
MTNSIKEKFLSKLRTDFGSLEKISSSDSLYEFANTNIRIYIRYSKVFESGVTFYGLRKIDLKDLESHPSLICFLWENQKEPLLIPSSFIEELLSDTEPASDGQYKAQILFKDGIQLYLPKIGKFDIEGYIGWKELEYLFSKNTTNLIPDFSHSQIQTLLASIGIKKNYDIYIPIKDRAKLDWNLSPTFDCRDCDFSGFEKIISVIQEVDVIWIKKGSNDLQALFEVEHSTPIYSGLLRLNDIHLTSPKQNVRYNIVANSIRNSLFTKQINRPTFKCSGLNELCAFLDYTNVYKWHQTISANR